MVAVQGSDHLIFQLETHFKGAAKGGQIAVKLIQLLGIVVIGVAIIEFQCGVGGVGQPRVELLGQGHVAITIDGALGHDLVVDLEMAGRDIIDQHLAEMLERYAGEVEFYYLQKPGSKGQLPKALGSMRHLSSLPGSQALPASPAVAIWDRSGHLAYFGPYSEGAVCNSSNSFIEPVLDALLENRPVAAANTLAVGCFCDWQQATAQ